MGVDRRNSKAKAKVAWLRKQERLREEWVMDVFRRTGRMPMCPWSGAHGEGGKVEMDVVGVGKALGMGESDELEGEGRGDSLDLAVKGEEKGKETETEQEKA